MYDLVAGDGEDHLGNDGKVEQQSPTGMITC